MTRLNASAGTLASLGLHAGAGFVLVVGWPHLNPMPPEPVPPIPVELIREAEIADRVEVRAQAKAEDPKEEPEPAPEPEEVEEAPPPEPDPAPQPAPEPPAPEPAPEPPAPNPEPTPEPASEPEAPAPEPVAEPTPEPEVSEPEDLDFAALEDDLVDLDPDRREAPKEVAPDAEGGPVDAERVGPGQRLLASEEALVQACMVSADGWQQLTGVPNAETLVVTVTFSLRPDGTLATQPKVKNAGQIARSGNAFWRVAQDRAVQAAMSCAPYDYLDPDRYEQWRDFEMTFTPPAG